MKTQLSLTIDGEQHVASVEGEMSNDKSEGSLATDDDLTSGCEWSNAGYVVAPFISENSMNLLLDSIRQVALEAIYPSKLDYPDDFELERYHQYLSENNDHAKIVAEIRSTLQHRLPETLLGEIDETISRILNVEVSSIHPWKERERVQIRVVRPGRQDYNPPHRDVWLPHLRNGINIYVPLAGSTRKSSLPVAPGSHLWTEDGDKRTMQGSVLNGIKFSVPSSLSDLEMVRPNPGAYEVLVFSPYMLHGYALNLEEDKTRISLEMRFWRK
ncbi:MAG: hypothetical protein AAF362_10210 [Pseudomonadota bacterium]